MTIARIPRLPAGKQLSKQVSHRRRVGSIGHFDLFRMVVDDIEVYDDHFVYSRFAMVIKPRGNVGHTVLSQMKLFAAAAHPRVRPKPKGERAEIASFVEHIYVSLFEFQNIQQVKDYVFAFEKHTPSPLLNQNIPKLFRIFNLYYQLTGVLFLPKRYNGDEGGDTYVRSS